MFNDLLIKTVNIIFNNKDYGEYKNVIIRNVDKNNDRKRIILLNKNYEVVSTIKYTTFNAEWIKRNEQLILYITLN
jgi:hypothetical protein